LGEGNTHHHDEDDAERREAGEVRDRLGDDPADAGHREEVDDLDRLLLRRRLDAHPEPREHEAEDEDDPAEDEEDPERVRDAVAHPLDGVEHPEHHAPPGLLARRHRRSFATGRGACPYPRELSRTPVTPTATEGALDVGVSSRVSGRLVTGVDDFLIARNPEPDSRLPYLVRIPLGEGVVLKTKDVWPRTSKLYCHRTHEWPEDADIVERIPTRSCTSRGAAIDLVLDRRRENRSQFVITRIRGGRQAIFWQTAR